MKKTIRQYRGMKDFRFGSFHVRTGSAWLEISGRRKNTGKDTVFMRVEFEAGHGTILIDEKERE